MVVPQNGWFIVEIPMKMDDLGTMLVNNRLIRPAIFFRVLGGIEGVGHP